MYNPDQDVKDHSLIIVDGVYHMFYIVANERNFGHATSMTLSTGPFPEPVLYKGLLEDWDEKDIWAPCVVPMEGTDGHYLMFYTGVEDFLGGQQTGMAYSFGGLDTWSKIR